MPYRRLSRFVTAATTVSTASTVTAALATLGVLALTAPVAASAPVSPVSPVSPASLATPVSPASLAAPAAPASPADLSIGSSPRTAPLPRPSRSSDHLTITVSDSGKAATNGTYELYCHPARGTHTDARGACDKLDSLSRWGKDLFAGVPKGSKCTMQYGGPATAHVTGTWAGRPVNAQFSRADGCEISRWNRFVPVLPSVAS
ncbi:SSI family serine proteinase inhibitor [Streptomyces chrestomyceticus]|uniref:SSI family serine proteinase inhibitor n=1 Tax=Streptomyces chrestomyceticus TaxID=68185 RepID=UPI0019D2F8C5|nr:SSI family serine proteinase inhibitor [Streptomyces chrestomyceticus]